jgi:hypothetical protein
VWILFRETGQTPYLFSRFSIFGHVSEDPGEVPFPSRPDFTHGKIQRERTPVLTAPHDLPPDADDLSLARAQVLGDILIVVFVVRRWLEGIHISSDDLCGRVAKMAALVERPEDAKRFVNATREEEEEGSKFPRPISRGLRNGGRAVFLWEDRQELARGLG